MCSWASWRIVRSTSPVSSGSSAEVAARVGVALVEESDLAQQLLGVRHDLVALHALDRDGRLDEVFQHREVREQVEVLEHHAHAATDAAHFGFGHVAGASLGVIGHQGLAIDADLALVDELQVVQAAQQRALARTRGADQRHHLALVDAQRHAAQDLQRPEALVQVAGIDHCRGGAGRAGRGRRAGQGGHGFRRRDWHSVFRGTGTSRSAAASSAGRTRPPR